MCLTGQPNNSVGGERIASSAVQKLFLSRKSYAGMLFLQYKLLFKYAGLTIKQSLYC